MYVVKQGTLKSSSLILFALALLVASAPVFVRADDLTGLPLDDPKDLRPSPPPTISETTGSLLFLPMPSWSRGVVMPPLPDQLKPMGPKTRIATAASAPSTPPPLAPPKDETVTTTASSGSPSKSTPASSDNSNPAMVTVSPFLQWIKSNPQAAAEQARQQAESYHASSIPDAATSSGPVPGNAGAPGGGGNPYWLPPLIDSSDFSTKTVGGSAAIYETPQR